MKISEWLKQKLDNENLSLRKAANKYSLSHNQIGLILKGKYDDPSVLVAKNLINTFHIDEDTLLSLLPEKDSEFFEEVFDISGDVSCEKALSRFIDIYYSEVDNRYWVDAVAADIGPITKIDHRTKFVDYDVNKYAVPGYQAIEEITMLTKTEPKSIDDNIAWTGGLNGDDEYEIPIFLEENNFTSVIYYLPYRIIRSDTRYFDENCKDFVNKLMYLLSHNIAEADNYIFFTTSKNLFECIKRMFEESISSNKTILLVYLSNNSDKIEEFIIS